VWAPMQSSLLLHEVTATASPKNFEYVKKLDASAVFYYNSPSVVQELVESFKSKTHAGALDCIVFSAQAGCIDVVHKSAGNRFVATVKPAGGVPDGVGIKHYEKWCWQGDL
jgi:hypothetical protein